MLLVKKPEFTFYFMCKTYPPNFLLMTNYHFDIGHTYLSLSIFILEITQLKNM